MATGIFSGVGVGVGVGLGVGDGVGIGVTDALPALAGSGASAAGQKQMARTAATIIKTASTLRMYV